MNEIRTHVTFLYPSAFFPENGSPIRIDNGSTEFVLAAAKDDNWFAAKVTIREYELWTSERGAEKWLATEAPVQQWRVYVGEELTQLDVRALGDEYRVLLANMQSNRWAKVVRTRFGNFQPVEFNDVVLAAVPA